MPRLRTLAPLIRSVPPRLELPAKQKDPIYNTPEFQAWRAEVIARADGRCEAITNGHRCSNAQPERRMYADHIVELRDFGKPFDVNNGQCLCASHHTIKTMAMRNRRLKWAFVSDPPPTAKTGG